MTTVRSGIKISHRNDTGTIRGGVVRPAIPKPRISHRDAPGRGGPAKKAGRARAVRKPG